MMYLIMGGRAGASSQPAWIGPGVGVNVAEYLRQRVALGEITHDSARSIRGVLVTWERFAGDDPYQWTAELVAAWVHDPAIRANYAKSRITKLGPYCRWLIDEDRLDRDPTRKVGRIRIPPGDPRDLEPDEIRRLVDVAPDERGRLIIVWMAQLGLRAGDMARVRLEDIDTRRKVLQVRGKGGRGDITHPVSITAEAWELYQRWAPTLGRWTGPLVESYQRPGRHLTPKAVSKLVGAWMREAGLKDFPYDGRASHSLRHSCAQHMVDGGAEVRDVQQTLGHKDPRTAEIYLRRRRMDQLRAAMEGRRYTAA